MFGKKLYEEPQFRIKKFGFVDVMEGSSIDTTFDDGWFDGVGGWDDPVL